MQSDRDRDLLDCWRRGDAAAGSALVKRHFDALHRFFANKAPRECEDLLQQTFLACLTSRDAIRDGGSFRAFLFGVARMQLLTHFRRSHRARQIDFNVTSVRDLGTTPTSAIARAERAELIRAALRAIPVDQQIALELTYWEGMDAPSVARVLGIPENTVYSRLTRARLRLRESLLELALNEEVAARAYALLDGGGNSAP
jgi:RNA polymerase sigma-70 factor (ECF subfamily)